MRASVLVDNIGNKGLPGEWGLSFYIEYKEKKDPAGCRTDRSVCGEC